MGEPWLPVLNSVVQNACQTQGHCGSSLRLGFHKPRKAMAVWIQFLSGVSNKAAGIRKGHKNVTSSWILWFDAWRSKKKKKWSFLFVWYAQCTTKRGSWQIMALNKYLWPIEQLLKVLEMSLSFRKSKEKDRCAYLWGNRVIINICGYLSS